MLFSKETQPNRQLLLPTKCILIDKMEFKIKLKGKRKEISNVLLIGENTNLLSPPPSVGVVALLAGSTITDRCFGMGLVPNAVIILFTNS